MAGQLISTARPRPPSSCGDLRERVLRIGQLHHQGALSILATEVHSLKMAARAWRFDAVEQLAHVLEANLAEIGPAAMVDVYIDRIGDAIDCDDISPAAMETMMACIRARLVS